MKVATLLDIRNSQQR